VSIPVQRMAARDFLELIFIGGLASDRKRAVLESSFMKINVVAVVLLSLFVFTAQGQVTPPLTLQRTIPLPTGTGKFDHFAIDLNANRLFIAATGNQSVEVLDLSSGEVTENLTGLGKPHGLAWIAATSRLYAADGSQADLKMFEGSPLNQAKSVKLSDDADDMVYDAKSKLLYVGHGGGGAANPARIAVLDTTNQTLVTNLFVATHPEGLEIDNAKDRIFVNIADAAEVVVIDGATHTQTATWKLTRAKDNVPLAYDEEHQILFVACRTPARLLVLDANSGKELEDLPSDAGADDIFYDPKSHRIYLIAGSGAVNVYEIDDSKTVRTVGSIRTSAGAKTGLLVPSQHALFVGAPAAEGKQAEILLYSAK
jgi:DNA-binding beta-propeller fold protein YncE